METQKQEQKEQSIYLSCSETAKLVRKALKENFPSQKFSVRSSVYSGGASIDVSWENGLGVKKVEKIIKQFSGAGFDGMVDYKFYRSHWIMPDGSIQDASSEGSACTGGYSQGYDNQKPHPDAKKVHFGADYVFAHREISEEISESCARQLAELEGIEFRGMGDYPKDTGIGNGDNWYNITHQFLYDRDIEGNNIKVVRTDVMCGNWQEFFELSTSKQEETKLVEVK